VLAVADTESIAAGKVTGLLLTPARLRVWGWRSAMSLLDQGLTSGAGFGVNLLLARWMTPKVYGAFAVAFAGFLFVSGFHNVLLLEPLTVLGPSRHAGKLPAYFRAQIKVHGLLVGGLSAAVLLAGVILWRVAPDSPLIGAVVGAGLALPFLLLAWLARRMCYVVQQPAAAALGSGFYLSFVAAGLFVLGHYGWLGSFTAFLLMGSGSVFAACLLLRRLGLWKHEPATELGVSWRAALQENWSYGRWLVGGTVLSSISGQTQMFLVAGMLGLGAAGILRAMQLPSLVMMQAVMSTGPLFLPAFSSEFGRGVTKQIQHKALLVSLGLGAAALFFAGLLAAFAGSIEHIFFGGKYETYAWLMPFLALVPTASGFNQGFSLALRATQRPYFDLIANVLAAPIGVISAIALMRWWGVGGAATSLVLSYSSIAIVTVFCYLRFGHRTNQSSSSREAV
jgi:O-antigen/teichoic acid export membrane protein